MFTQGSLSLPWLKPSRTFLLYLWGRKLLQWFEKPQMIRLLCSLSDFTPFCCSFFHNTLDFLGFFVVLALSKLLLASGPLWFLFLLPVTFSPDNYKSCLFHSALCLSVISPERAFLTTLCKESVPSPHYSPLLYSALVFFLALRIILFDICFICYSSVSPSRRHTNSLRSGIFYFEGLILLTILVT